MHVRGQPCCPLLDLRHIPKTESMLEQVIARCGCLQNTRILILVADGDLRVYERTAMLGWRTRALLFTAKRECKYELVGPNSESQ
jgi:hypothetical protein